MQRSLLTLSLMVALCLSASAGDLTIKSTVESKGAIGLLNMQGTQQMIISGDMSREESSMKSTSKTMKMLGAGKPQETVQITRLDKELFWQLTPKDKEYTELTFADFRAQAEQSLGKAGENKKQQADDSLDVSTEVKIDRTGKTQQIAGYNAEQVLVTIIFKGKDSESGESGEFKVNLDMWLSKDVPGMTEYVDFQKRLAEKLGILGPNQNFGKALASLGANDKDIWKRMGDLEGIPLMTTMTAVPAGDSLAAATQNAERRQTVAEGEAESAEESSEEETDSKAVASKALKGLFGKKKVKKGDDDNTESAKQDAPQYLFHITNTVTEVGVTPVSQASFEIPEGYKKK
ncbi:MAG: hypothetical protein AB1644_01770 [Candidatus Zixiibacteriota bacterium]